MNYRQRLLGAIKCCAWLFVVACFWAALSCGMGWLFVYVPGCILKWGQLQLPQATPLRDSLVSTAERPWAPIALTFSLAYVGVAAPHVFRGDMLDWSARAWEGLLNAVLPGRAKYPHEAATVRGATIARLRRKAVHPVRKLCSKAASAWHARRWRSYATHAPEPMRYSRLLECIHYVEGVRVGHLDFFGRACAERVIDAAGVLNAGMRPNPISSRPVEQAYLQPGERQRLLEDISGLQAALVGDIAWKFRSAGITKLVSSGTLANDLLCQALAKRLRLQNPDGGGNSATHLRVIHSDEKGLDFDPTSLGNLRGTPILDNENVLVVEANLARKEVLESIVCLVRKRAQNVTIMTCVVFDGSDRRFRRRRFGVKKSYRVVRARLGIVRAEKCRWCKRHHDLATPDGFDFKTNYLSC